MKIPDVNICKVREEIKTNRTRLDFDNIIMCIYELQKKVSTLETTDNKNSDFK